jgi:hypothetical protein
MLYFKLDIPGHNSFSIPEMEKDAALLAFPKAYQVKLLFY